MRLTSLLLLVAIVGGVGYVAVFQREWVAKMFRKGVETAEGYTAAKTPHDAMDFFRKAIKARKFETASLYVSGPYAEHLARAGKQGVDNLGAVLDQIHEYAENKGILGDRSRNVLFHLDPFPTSFKIHGEPKKSGEDKATGYYAPDGIISVQPLGGTELNAIDQRMFLNNIRPLPLAVFYNGIELVREGQGDDAVWKLNFPPLNPAQLQALNYYIENFKGYETALRQFRGELTNARYDSKEAFQRELLDVVRRSKG